MSAPLAAYNFDETGNPVVDYGAPGGADFSLAGTNALRVAGHTEGGLRSGGTAVPSLPDVGRTARRTIMAWLSFTGIPTSWPVLFNAPSIDSGAWGILHLAPNIVIQARSATTLARASAAWDGGTHHVAGVYDETAIRLYVDGALATAPVPLAGPLRTDTDPPTLWSGTGAMASGYLDDLRIYGDALTEAEIITAMNTPVADLTPEDPPPTTPDPAPVGGWRTLGQIARWNAAELERERNTAPVACPRHGDPLDSRDGVLHCPFGHTVAT